MNGLVHGLHRSSGHDFSKEAVDEIEVVAGLGVRGDAHFGATVQHRSRVRADPSQPNLRQVHLIDRTQLDQIGSLGHAVRPGDLGENVTTEGLDLTELPAGTLLRIGPEVLLALTGLRNPCGQIRGFSPAVSAALPASDGRTASGRLAGVMSVAVVGGMVRVGDRIEAVLPPEPHGPLLAV